ncbi:MAG: diacylglycerol O-acyltransferase / wax synthase, partial [Solirubrobacteraceae bacterium]|nr:diacylglycerol O-acyltransferase / wax synthase [Solirubrobacteraceae bacterium]
VDLFPIAFLPKDHALAVAIMSYDGGIAFGLLGDYDTMYDLDALGDDIGTALAELVETAARHSAETAASSANAPVR